MQVLFVESQMQDAWSGERGEWRPVGYHDTKEAALKYGKSVTCCMGGPTFFFYRQTPAVLGAEEHSEELWGVDAQGARHVVRGPELQRLLDELLSPAQGGLWAALPDVVVAHLCAAAAAHA
jgi:hypothetical protein